MLKIIDGNITAPQGFFATATHAGIRKKSGKLDLALIYSEVPATAAGVFTLNQVKAAPVLLSQAHLEDGLLQAIIVNSGNANACTGEEGEMHALQMTQAVATGLHLDSKLVGVASTGVIGVPMPINKILKGIEINVATLHDKKNTPLMAAEAIMTTDTFSKHIAVQCEISGKKIRIGGIAKGSGMIHPNMATMLGFITTDVAISKIALQAALTRATKVSFNMITVDGDCSTNDMVLALANGCAENPIIETIKDPHWEIFTTALEKVCIHLAKEIARDGEGATKVIEVNVSGAQTVEEARIGAREICRSPLVKTAIAGEDANWGRVASAVGASDAKLDPKKLCIAFGDLVLLKDGTPLPFDEDIARALLQKKHIVINVYLGKGEASATAWGCDLTYDYVKINASYRS